MTTLFCLQEARRREEQDYVCHPDAADKGISLAMHYLRERGMIGRSPVSPFNPFDSTEL